MRLCLKDSGILIQTQTDDIVKCSVCGHQYTGEMLEKVPRETWDEIRNTRSAIIGDKKVTLDPRLMVFTEEQM